LRKDLPEGKAFEWEKFYIKHYGRIDLGTGILRNLTDGGEGQSGRIASEAVREKLKKNHKAREAAKLKTQKAIELTRIADGAVFIFDCTTDAARVMNLNREHLGAVCSGKRYSTGGFLARHWSPDSRGWGKGLFHVVEEVKQNKKNARIKSSVKSREICKLRRQKAVELTRILDNNVFVFCSASEAARALKIHRGHLSSVCLGKLKSTGGYTARYLESNAG
jgi:hypothetical protein